MCICICIYIYVYVIGTDAAPQVTKLEEEFGKVHANIAQISESLGFILKGPCHSTVCTYICSPPVDRYTPLLC